MLSDIGFFIFGAGMGAVFVLAVWHWYAGRDETKHDSNVFEDYYPPVTHTTPVEEVVATRVKAARSKRIKNRKKPVSKTRRQK